MVGAWVTDQREGVNLEDKRLNHRLTELPAQLGSLLLGLVTSVTGNSHARQCVGVGDGWTRQCVISRSEGSAKPPFGPELTVEGQAAPPSALRLRLEESSRSRDKRLG